MPPTFPVLEPGRISLDGEGVIGKSLRIPPAKGKWFILSPSPSQNQPRCTSVASCPCWPRRFVSAPLLDGCVVVPSSAVSPPCLKVRKGERSEPERVVVVASVPTVLRAVVDGTEKIEATSQRRREIAMASPLNAVVGAVEGCIEYSIFFSPQSFPRLLSKPSDLGRGRAFGVNSEVTSLHAVPSSVHCC